MISHSSTAGVVDREGTYGDLNTVIGKDESGVRGGELGGGHLVDGVVLTGEVGDGEGRGK